MMGQIHIILLSPFAALIVRFLTKRYIGEYDHQTENRYKHEAMVDGEPVLFEILDTCPKVPTLSKTYPLLALILHSSSSRPTMSIPMPPS